MSADDNGIKVILEVIQRDISAMKKAITGDGERDGLILDVDRLKRSRQTHNKVLWTILTVGLGVVATVAAQVITNGF